ncbi:MAG TPA: DUF3303 family protein [Actinomycetota bacterium]|nr:DUF3303 family protein [Actinomycetota bacterium]
MLHMVVNTHTPQDCAFRGSEEEKLLTEAFESLEGSGPGEGVEVRGSWVNRASHEIFVLAEAPDAHSIERALLAAGLVGRTHSRILPVIATDDA